MRKRYKDRERYTGWLLQGPFHSSGVHTTSETKRETDRLRERDIKTEREIHRLAYYRAPSTAPECTQRLRRRERDRQTD